MLVGRSRSSGAHLILVQLIFFPGGAHQKHHCQLWCTHWQHEDTSFQPGTSLLQVVAFNRPLLKATLRLTTGNVALQTPPSCASQQSVSHINAQCLWALMLTWNQVKNLSTTTNSRKGGSDNAAPNSFHWLWVFFPPFKRALCCCFHCEQFHLIKVKPTGWSVHGGREEETIIQNQGAALGEEQLHQPVSWVSYHENYVSFPPSPKHLIQGRRCRIRSPLSSHVTSNHIHSASPI